MSALTWQGFGFMEQTNGISPEARQHAESMVDIVIDASIRPAGSLRRKDELHDVANQHGLLRTYDGIMTLTRATAFLDALPAEVTQPIASVDPDGEIAFDWYRSDDFLSLSIGPAGLTSYAAEIGGQQYVGAACSVSTLPAELSEIVSHFA